ncbi:MAG: histidinol dehydrogenase, partial [Methylocella sp.]
MPLRLDTRSPDFAASFNALLAMKREVSEDVDQAVQAIIADVAAHGDAALISYSRQFDRVDLEKLGLRVGAADVDAAFARCPPDALDALRFAQARIVAFHERQLPQDLRFTDPLGVELGWRWRPIEAAGL